MNPSLFKWLYWCPVIPPLGTLRAMLSHFEALLSRQAHFLKHGARCLLHIEPLQTHAGIISKFDLHTIIWLYKYNTPNNAKCQQLFSALIKSVRLDLAYKFY